MQDNKAVAAQAAADAALAALDCAGADPDSQAYKTAVSNRDQAKTAAAVALGQYTSSSNNATKQVQNLAAAIAACDEDSCGLLSLTNTYAAIQNQILYGPWIKLGA